MKQIFHFLFVSNVNDWGKKIIQRNYLSLVFYIFVTLILNTWIFYITVQRCYLILDETILPFSDDEDLEKLTSIVMPPFSFYKH